MSVYTRYYSCTSTLLRPYASTLYTRSRGTKFSIIAHGALSRGTGGMALFTTILIVLEY